MDHLQMLSQIFIEEHSLTNVTTGTPDEGKVLNKEYFEQNLEMKILKMEENKAVFEINHVDVSFVNGLRRVLLAEVPTMAFDHIALNTNTSVLPDEILSHRIGLCPVKVDPHLFVDRIEDSEPSEKDALQFDLHVKCERNTKARREVTTADLKWVPLGDQANMFPPGEEPRLVDVEYPIVLTKLSPGQEVDLKAYCFKGTSTDHAKFQPVSTAYYKFLPQIYLKKKITGEDAKRLQACFSPGVIEIHEENGKEVARVAKPGLDTVSRNFFRHKDFAESVEQTLVKDQFIFTVESTGILSPVELFKRAVAILIAKSACILEAALGTS